MIPLISPSDFSFTYLHDYARYLVENHLDEFVLVGIRFSREAELPLLKPLSKFSEEELVKLGRESNRKLLTALAENKYAAHLEESSKKWLDNSMVILDREEVLVEDITMGFYLRRKIFSHFLDVYTKNVVLQKFIIAEVDKCTTKEELNSYSLYLHTQQEKLVNTNAELEFHKQLLLDAQELGGMGSFAINMKELDKSYLSPQYKKIFEMDSTTTFDNFMQWVHEDDRDSLKTQIDAVYAHGGTYEVDYRYNKSGKQKRIWSKGFALVEQGKPILLRGVAREME